MLFQSHLGSISTVPGGSPLFPHPRFQSHLGSISTVVHGQPPRGESLFQSHLGSISTLQLNQERLMFNEVSIPPWFD